MADLRKLDSVKKKMYIDKVLRKDTKLAEVIKTVGENILDRADDVQDMIEGIEDTHDDWEKLKNIVNKNLAVKAEENGITHHFW